MTNDEMLYAMRQARTTLESSNLLAEQAISFAVGRLSRMSISIEDLRAFKRELRDFDITTGKWK